MKVDVITVNTPTAEIQMAFGDETVDEALEKAERAYPEWSSMVVIVVRMEDEE